VRIACVLLLGVLSACDRDGGRNRIAPLTGARAERAPVSAPADTALARYRDGDLIFQRSRSGQSEMVGALTRSRWTHMGVVFVEPPGPVVLEAVSPVRRTRFGEWVARGSGRHHVVKRLRDGDRRLTPEVVAAMRALGDRWVGRPYDLQFRWEDDALYCSELAYKLFDRAANVQIGRIERARDMNLEDPRVKRALAARYQNREFNPGEPVVTPESMFRDEQLLTIHEE
jgi:hypothetical protein